jgi:hypothetical protein
VTRLSEWGGAQPPSVTSGPCIHLGIVCLLLYRPGIPQQAAHNADNLPSRPDHPAMQPSPSKESTDTIATVCHAGGVHACASSCARGPFSCLLEEVPHPCLTWEHLYCAPKWCVSDASTSTSPLSISGMCFNRRRVMRWCCRVARGQQEESNGGRHRVHAALQDTLSKLQNCSPSSLIALLLSPAVCAPTPAAPHTGVG